MPLDPTEWEVASGRNMVYDGRSHFNIFQPSNDLGNLHGNA